MFVSRPSGSYAAVEPVPEYGRLLSQTPMLRHPELVAQPRLLTWPTLCPYWGNDRSGSTEKVETVQGASSLWTLPGRGHDRKEGEDDDGRWMKHGVQKECLKAAACREKQVSFSDPRRRSEYSVQWVKAHVFRPCR